MKNNSGGALSGITVLDLSRLLPGPFCSMVLADHGARVISIEDKRFIDEGAFLVGVRRNKEHITLNLKSDAGREIFFRLLKEADVVMEGFRPGVVKKLGIDYETVKTLNPGIIYCSITGYGQTGTMKDRAGHDVNFLGVSGVLDLIGEKENPPAIPGVQIADIFGGAMNAVTGILLALHARTRTGKGQYIDISMTDGCVQLLSLALDFQYLTGEAAVRSDSMLSHRYAFYNTYETKDKKYLTLGALEPRFWKTFCEHMGVPEYASLQFDDSRRVEITSCLRDIFKTRTLASWEAEFADLDICWGPVRTLDEVMDDSDFKKRGIVAEINGSNGEKTGTIGIPVLLSGTPGSLRTPPVPFGSSTDKILKEIGYSEYEIKAFHTISAI